MRKLYQLAVFALFAPLLLHAKSVSIPAGIDHTEWDVLLTKYVDAQGLVNYKGWNANKEDRGRLDRYLDQFAPEQGEKPTRNDEITSLINAYNAFTIDFILDNYPTESIRKLDDPFTERRYKIGGQMVSADDIEHDTLRPIIGWKVHSVVVCAALSCPPLMNSAFTASDWENQVAERYRVWLAREDLNSYDPGAKRVDISKIFDWYEDDFTGDHSVKKVLAEFGPAQYHTFLESGDYKIKYPTYRWGLNGQFELGRDYKHSWFGSLF